MALFTFPLIYQLFPDVWKASYTISASNFIHILYWPPYSTDNFISCVVPGTSQWFFHFGEEIAIQQGSKELNCVILPVESSCTEVVLNGIPAIPKRFNPSCHSAIWQRCIATCFTQFLKTFFCTITSCHFNFDPQTMLYLCKHGLSELTLSLWKSTFYTLQ